MATHLFSSTCNLNSLTTGYIIDYTIQPATLDNNKCDGIWKPSWCSWHTGNWDLGEREMPHPWKFSEQVSLPAVLSTGHRQQTSTLSRTSFSQPCFTKCTLSEFGSQIYAPTNLLQLPSSQIHHSNFTLQTLPSPTRQYSQFSSP